MASARPEVVNANDERPEVLKGADRPQIDERERHAHEREQGESNFEIGVRHHGVTVLIRDRGAWRLGMLSRFIELPCAETAAAAGASSKPAEEPPAVPLKM